MNQDSNQNSVACLPSNNITMEVETDSKNETLDPYKHPEFLVLEIRKKSPDITPASTVLNSPDITEIHYSQNHHHQICVGRSPASQHASHPSSKSPNSPTDLGNVNVGIVREGEIVVFDDIDTDWPKGGDHENVPDDVLKVTKMIGQLPITEYEGSPRRIGNYQYDMQPKTLELENGNDLTQSLLVPPRPGFPRRISTNYQEVDRTLKRNDEVDLKEESNNAYSKKVGFDYLYEFSETRKVLEEFFKCPGDETEKKFSDYVESDDLGNYNEHQDCLRTKNTFEQTYIGQRLARIPNDEFLVHKMSPKKHALEEYDQNDFELYVDSNSSGEIVDTANVRRHSRNFTLSPETTDYDSNCGDLDSLSNEMNCQTDFGRLYTSMPVLEDGLSSGHASDTENNMSVLLDRDFLEMTPMENVQNDGKNETHNSIVYNTEELISSINIQTDDQDIDYEQKNLTTQSSPSSTPTPLPQRLLVANETEHGDIKEALKDIRSILQRTKAIPGKPNFNNVSKQNDQSPVWVPRIASPDEITITESPPKEFLHEEEEADTDLETDRLLGQQRVDETGFHEYKSSTKSSRLKSSKNSKITLSPSAALSLNATNNTGNGKCQTFSSATVRQGIGTSLTSLSEKGNVSKIIDVAISPKTKHFSKSPPESIKSKRNANDDSNVDNQPKSRNKEDANSDDSWAGWHNPEDPQGVKLQLTTS